MAYDESRTELTAFGEERCDIKVWSGDCLQSNSTSVGDKYLCSACGIIGNLDHEVRHEIFPHVSGDEKYLY